MIEQYPRISNGTKSAEEHPTIKLAELLKDAGVMDAPAKLEELAAENGELRKSIANMQRSLDATTNVSAALIKSHELMARAVAAMERMSHQKVLPVAFKIPKELVAKIEGKPQDVHVSSPVTVAAPDTEAMAKALAAELLPVLRALADRPPHVVEAQTIDADALGKSLAIELMPVLKSLADRPAPTVDAPDMSEVAKAIGSIVERVNSPAPVNQVQVDLTPLSD